MTNTSATGGPLAPNPTPAPQPLEGQALLTFLQGWMVGILGISGTLVRPRWQPEPPNIPTEGTAWVALGITARPSDTYPFIGRVAGVIDADQLQRHEQLNILCSFYDLGSGGQADSLAAILRDGVAVPQNRELLAANGMGLTEIGEPLTVPSLLKQRWLYRVDLPLVVGRQIVRQYPVLSLQSAVGTLVAEAGSGEIASTIEVTA
jgi:hypothetical protein